MGSRDRDRDREHLIPSAPSLEDGVAYKPSPTSSSSASSSPAASTISTSHHSSREAICKVIQSWASKKFMTGCVILFPIAITFYITWWFVHFVDGFFSPIYAHFGIDIFGKCCLLSRIYDICNLHFRGGYNYVILVLELYLSVLFTFLSVVTDQDSKAFKEVAIIRHPRVGEYALGFITSSLILKRDTGAEELCCVYVPTNHLYVGDMYLINWRDIIRPKLSVREGIEIVVSGGLSVPQVLATLEARSTNADVFKLKCASP
ncbi:hypothetical protein EJ110_NYTH54699 [Nymphaea thermarum]|nr:hypothetical protein EJ110_NYTH54699 [Nymphaea thermarum]